MSRTLPLLIAVFVSAAAGVASGQERLGPSQIGDRFHGPQDIRPHFGPADTRWQPFGDYEFEYDFQWFKFAKLDEYGGEPLDANTGWYGSYDRIAMNVSRGSTAPFPYEGDFGYGNRWEAGYMTDDNYGWNVVGWHINGPTVFDANLTSTVSIELNRVWRTEPWADGSYFEPFVGARYYNVEDLTFGPVINNMVGGQIGLRWFKQKGHFVLSATGKGFALANFQFFNTPEVNDSLDEFVPGGEAQLQLSYLVSQKVAFNIGWDLQYLGRGIGRNALNPFANTDSMVMTGVYGGFEINR